MRRGERGGGKGYCMLCNYVETDRGGGGVACASRGGEEGPKLAATTHQHVSDQLAVTEEINTKGGEGEE